MATTVTRGTTGNIGKEDLNIQSSSTETFTRTGTTLALTKVGRHTLNTREYDVMQWGAVGDGTTDDTEAIQAAITEAQTAGGGMIVFPAGYTFRVQPPTVNLPIFAIDCSNLTFFMYGATIKVTATTSLDPTTTENEQRKAWVFKAIGYENLSFFGGTFNGNRDDATQDPRYGFFCGIRCNHVKIHDMTLKNCNTYLGPISGDAYDPDAASSSAQLVDWDISRNLIEQCNSGIWISGSMRHMRITHNALRYMNLAPYGAAGPQFTDTAYAATKLCRGIRLSGYGSQAEDAYTALGEISDIDVSYNTIEGGAWSIELWNSDATNGRNPTRARRVRVNGNTIWGEHGISVNYYSNVEIGDNTFTRMTDAELAVYAGRHYNSAGTDAAGLTTMAFGAGIEAAPCFDINVHDNVLDGAWTFTLNSSSPSGIIIGANDATFRINGDVRGNTVTRFYEGIRVYQMENSAIVNNVIRECRGGLAARWNDTSARVAASGFTWKNNTLRGNQFHADPVAHAPGGSGTALASLMGDWIVENNVFVGLAAEKTSLSLFSLSGFSSTASATGPPDISNYILRGNTFKAFDYQPLTILGSATTSVVRIHMDGNHFDSENSSLGTAIGMIRIERPLTSQSITFTAGTNTAVRANRIIQWDKGATLGTETYNLGRWVTGFTDSSTQQMTTNDGGTAYINDAPVDVSYEISGSVRGKSILVNCDGGALTETVNDFIPANSLILGCSARVNTVIVMGGGGATWSLGTENDAECFGTGFAKTAATMTSIGSASLSPPAGLRTTGATAEDLVLTCNAGTFTSGYVLVQIQYILMTGEVQ